jgi:hypothetical protein
MPLLLLPYLAVGGLGFGAGFITSEATGKAIKIAAVIGGGYLIYKTVSK